MTRILTLLSLFAITLFSPTLWAKADESAAFKAQMEAMEVKPYHHSLTMMGKDTSCQLCHGVKTPIAAPEDKNCLSCHGTRDQIAAMTEPDPNVSNAEPNPHDSVHYGKDGSCTMCHNEHRESEIYCNSCHLFKYPNMKP